MAAFPTKLTWSVPQPSPPAQHRPARDHESSRAASTPTSHQGMMAAHGQPDDGGDDVEPVSGGVEHLAEPALLVQARAIFPSSQSDGAGGDQQADRPAVPACGPSTSHRNTGTPSSRATLIALGMVRMRSAERSRRRRACRVCGPLRRPAGNVSADGTVPRCSASPAGDLAHARDPTRPIRPLPARTGRRSFRRFAGTASKSSLTRASSRSVHGPARQRAGHARRAGNGKAGRPRSR